MANPVQMDGYIRVSRVKGRTGDSFISPVVQREQIEGWAKMRGVEIAAWHEDLDQSGGKLDRPGLNALLARIERGKTQGVVVAKLDRLSRLGVGDALKLVERITDGGGTVAAIDLGIDPTTPIGKFARTLMLALAEMERERIGESWQIAQERAIERGVPVSRISYGYLKGPDGMLEPDPIESDHVRTAFELAASSGIPAATAYLERNASERTWTTSYVRQMLSRRVYLGEVRTGKRLNMVNAEAHPPLVTRAIFEAAQQDGKSYSRSGSYPLSGLARCATCGQPMVAGSKAGNGKRTYICRAAQTFHKRQGGARCIRPASIVADRLEQYAVEFLRAQWTRDDWQVPTSEPEDEASEARRELEDAEAELFAFAADLTLRKALGSRYHDALALRERAVENAQAAFREWARESSRQTFISPDDLDIDDPETLRDLFKATFSLIEVSHGRGKVEDRVRLVFQGSWLGRQVERALSTVLSP